MIGLLLLTLNTTYRYECFDRMDRQTGRHAGRQAGGQTCLFLQNLALSIVDGVFLTLWLTLEER